MRTFQLFLVLFSLAITGAAQSAIKTESFTVYGNCGMCKNKIENCLKKVDGVTSPKYDIKMQILTVEFDPAKISLKEIAQKVADVGYDNAYARATDEKYNKLHECCQYKRPKS